jgi:hypothetical protein
VGLEVESHTEELLHTFSVLGHRDFVDVVAPLLFEAVTIVLNLVAEEAYLLDSYPTLGHLELDVTLVASVDDLGCLVVDLLIGVTKDE